MRPTPKPVDMESAEFLAELEKTKVFTDKVVNSKSLHYNPDEQVNIGIQEGLTRNKLAYGKRYCPCFLVLGDKEQDRICPCKPGMNEELPRDGHCHCGIFCSKEFVESKNAK